MKKYKATLNKTLVPGKDIYIPGDAVEEIILEELVEEKDIKKKHLKF